MASRVSLNNDKVRVLISEQRREVMTADTVESDMDLAFHLQLHEALAASLALQPSSSSSSSSSSPFVQIHQYDAVPQNDTVPTVASIHSEALARMEQEIKDRVQSEIETRKAREDLIRQIHDQNVAREIMIIPEGEWQESGDFFAKPFDGEGSSLSQSKNVECDNVFRLYFKGLVSEEKVGGDEIVVVAGIGVALCDPRDNLVFEVRKPLIGNGISRSYAQLKALIEGLTVALSLELMRITFFCDNYHIFQFVRGRWPAKQHKIAKLVNQVKSLQSKFTQCNVRLVPRNDMKFAFKLARDAIQSQSQTKQPAQSTTCKNVTENCVICLEDTDVSRMFSVDGCLHRYCFSCMKQHVEVKLLHVMVPRCPHEGCKSELSVNSCSKFLTPKHVETMRQRIKEASIPATERVYCPYPRCSALMTKSELLEHTNKTLLVMEQSGLRRCMKCNLLFCINCKVPWHRNMTCSDYKRLNPYPQEEDKKLKFLASKNLWRQCVKCNHMIELAEGCFHMTCRCTYEFCYNCGAEWKEKRPTCSCPLWDEGHIWHDEDEEDDFGEDDEEDDFDSDSDDDYLRGHEICRDCGAEWKDKILTCVCPLSDENDVEFEEEEDDGDGEDANEDNDDDDDDDYGDEDVDEDNNDDEDDEDDEDEEVREWEEVGKVQVQEAEDKVQEEDEEVQEEEVKGIQGEDKEVQGETYSLLDEDDIDFDEEYEEYEEEEEEEYFDTASYY